MAARRRRIQIPSAGFLVDKPHKINKEQMIVKKIAGTVIAFATLLLALGETRGQNVGQTGDSIANYIDINGMRQGPWRVTFPNGTTAYEGYFKNDKPQGRFTRYYSSGKVNSVSHFYAEGDICSVTFYGTAGNIVAQGRYVDRARDSVWHFYKDDGQPQAIESYRGGKRDGESTLYYFARGGKQEVAYYKDDIKHGPYQKFYPDGTLAQRTRYCEGRICDTLFIYYPNGQVEHSIPYVDDRRSGVMRTYDESGNLRQAIPYKDGVCLDPEVEVKENEEVRRLERNKGRYLEASQMDDPLDFLRKNQP